MSVLAEENDPVIEKKDDSFLEDWHWMQPETVIQQHLLLARIMIPAKEDVTY